MIRTLLIWILALVSIPFALSAEVIDADRLAAAGGWTTRQLDLDITIAPDEARLTIEGRMVLELTGEKTHFLAVLLNSRRPVMEIESMNVVKANGIDPAGVTITPDLRAEGIDSMRIELVEFPAELAPGQQVELSFTYRSVTESQQVIVRPDFSYASWVEAWYPVPTDGSNADDPHSGAKARAKGTTTFHVPAGWWVLSNGERTKRKASRSGVMEVWQDDYGTARSFAAAPFLDPQGVNIGDRTVAVYLIEPKKLDARAQAERLNQAIDVLAECFGPYPYATFAIAEMPADITSFGAASEQGFIVARTSFFEADDGNLALFAHEAGHTWWGNTVSTTGTGSLLCSESLAQFGAVLAIEAVDGEEAALDFLEFSRPGYVLSQCARGYFAYVRLGVDRPLAELDHSTRFDHNLSDGKGHWVYHMLRGRVGDEVFFPTMQDIVVRYSNRSISLDDMRREFIAAAPGAGLEQFFAQWLDRAGAPVLDLRWTLEKQMKENSYTESPLETVILGQEAPPFDVAVTVVQQQSGEPYVLDLEIEFTFVDGTTELRTLALTDATQEFALQVDKLPREIRLDPRRRTLLWRHVYGPRPEGETLSRADTSEP